jgi:peptidoglycan/LPS O-acetylase OafA/YrhL
VSGLCVAAALNFLFVPVLFRRPANAEWQRVLGGLSYPVFLCHWLIGTLIAIYIPALPPFSPTHCGFTALASVLFCLPIYYGVDRPTQKIRQVVKASGPFAKRVVVEESPAAALRSAADVG